MPGLVPGIRVFYFLHHKNVDGRDIRAKMRFALSPDHDYPSPNCAVGLLASMTVVLTNPFDGVAGPS
jgi:hypothetical protein